ncbi:hypothetical protein REF28_01325 [Serratia marcescens]|uniref:hypothetical protein n=1 Tax=Serratia marcescens TaxID=615 RepID=UPI003891385D
MKRFSLLMLAVFPLFANADCWIVEGLHGSIYSPRNNYKLAEDSYSGKYMLAINGDSASVTYSGVDAGGIIYRALSPNTIIGLSSDPDRNLIQTWVIQSDGTVLMTKTADGFGAFDSAQAMIGKVSGKC